MTDPTNNDLVSLRAQIDEMVTDLFRTTGVPFDETSELQRQVLASFAFGMVFATGQSRGLKPPEVHALVIACLMDVFKYADHQAASFSQDLIAAASGRGNPTKQAIIHRGID